MRKKYFGILAVYYLSLCITCSLIIKVRSEGNGIMKLCPSGGKSFITAWHLSCLIKKKRSPSLKGKRRWKRMNTYGPLSVIEMMHYCCNVGCKIRDLLPYCDPFHDFHF